MIRHVRVTSARCRISSARGLLDRSAHAQGRLGVAIVTVGTLNQGTLRQIATGRRARLPRPDVRMLVTNAAMLEGRKDAVTRYMRAYRETVDWRFASDDAIKPFAEFAGISDAMGKRKRGYSPRRRCRPTASSASTSSCPTPSR
jgi:hypothetical protein